MFRVMCCLNCSFVAYDRPPTLVHRAPVARRAHATRSRTSAKEGAGGAREARPGAGERIMRQLEVSACVAMLQLGC